MSSPRGTSAGGWRLSFTLTGSTLRFRYGALGEDIVGEKRFFFVRIFAPEADKLRELDPGKLDLFPGKETGRESTEWFIDGLLTEQQIVDLVYDGFQVLIESTMEARSRAEPVDIDPEAWIRAVLERPSGK